MTRHRPRHSRGGLLAVAFGVAVVATYTWTQHLWLAVTVGGLTVLALASALLKPATRPKGRRRAPKVRTRRPLAATFDHRPHVLYRIHDHGGDLIYIGICVTHAGRSVHDRVREHSRKQPWWAEVARIDAWETYPNRAAAFAAEKAAIDAAEDAGIRLYNKVHNEHRRVYDGPPVVRSQP